MFVPRSASEITILKDKKNTFLFDISKIVIWYLNIHGHRSKFDKWLLTQMEKY